MTADDLLSLLHESRELLVALSQSTHDRKAILDARDLARRIDDALAAHDAVLLGEESDESKAIWRAYVNRELSEDEAKARLAALEAK